VTPPEADAYFASRPRGSQIGAWASYQSRPLASREELLAAVERVEKQYAGATVPRPPHWSGYRLIPDRMEFWYGREDRLHERFEYTLENGVWVERILSP
jgi:pyridoxamine 5'-phosphate oxidase